MRWTSAKYRDIFDSRQDLEFFRDLAKSADRVLEVGAGTGRISLAMVEAGARVTAVEPDTDLREVLKFHLDEESKEFRNRLELMRGDIFKLQLARKFPLILLTGVFETLHTRDLRFDALRRFHDLLEPGGRLVFDLLSVNLGDFPLKEIDRIKRDGTEYIRKMSCKVDKVRNIANVQYVYQTYVSGNYYDQVVEEKEVAMVQPEEISEGLIEAGFRSFEFYGGYDRRPYDLYSRILVVEAWRR